MFVTRNMKLIFKIQLFYEESKNKRSYEHCLWHHSSLALKAYKYLPLKTPFPEFQVTGSMTKWSDRRAILPIVKMKPNPALLTPSPLLYPYNYWAYQVILNTKGLMWNNSWSNNGKWSLSLSATLLLPHTGVLPQMLPKFLSTNTSPLVSH